VIYAVKAEWVRTVGEARYYAFNYLTGVLVNFIIFAGLFLGLRGEASVEDFGTLITFALWIYAIAILDSTSVIVLEEAMLGTLEHVYVSATPLLLVLLGRVTFAVGRSAIVSVGLLLPGVLLVGAMTSWEAVELADWFALIVAAILALSSTFGLGLCLFGISIVFKRIGALRALIDIVLLLFSGIFLKTTSFPSGVSAAAHALPLTEPFAMLRSAIQGDGFPGMLRGSEFWGALTVALAYLGVGLLIYQVCLNVGRRTGALAHY